MTATASHTPSAAPGKHGGSSPQPLSRGGARELVDCTKAPYWWAGGSRHSDWLAQGSITGSWARRRDESLIALPLAPVRVRAPHAATTSSSTAGLWVPFTGRTRSGEVNAGRRGGGSMAASLWFRGAASGLRSRWSLAVGKDPAPCPASRAPIGASSPHQLDPGPGPFCCTGLLPALDTDLWGSFSVLWGGPRKGVLFGSEHASRT